MNCGTPGLPVHHQLPETTQTHVHWVGDAIQSSHPLLSPYPPALNHSQHQGLFKWVSSSHQSTGVAKVLEFQLQHYPSNEHSGLIFRMDWLDLLAVQGTLKSLLQHHSSKVSILRHSAFFIAQFSHPYMTLYQFKLKTWPQIPFKNFLKIWALQLWLSGILNSNENNFFYFWFFYFAPWELKYTHN